MMRIMYTGVMPLTSLWLRYEKHGDIVLVFETLRFLGKRVSFLRLDTQMKIINTLLDIHGPSLAANTISFCLYNLFR